MTSINLLPEDLRKREKSFKPKEPQKPEVEFVQQKGESAPAQAPKDYGKAPQEIAQAQKSVEPPARQTGSEVEKKPKQLEKVEESKKDVKGFLKGETIKRIFAKQKKTEEAEEHVDVNLLREEITLQRTIKPEIIKLIAIGALFIVLTYLVGFYFQRQNSSLQNELTKLEEQLNNLKTQQAAITAEREKIKEANAFIEAVYALIKNRINWPLFLGAIERRTFSTVYYQTLNMSDLENVIAVAKAQTIGDALAQVKFFERDTDFAKNVKLFSLQPRQEKVAAPGEGEPTRLSSFVEFTFTFTVNPQWIEKSVEGIAL